MSIKKSFSFILIAVLLLSTLPAFAAQEDFTASADLKELSMCPESNYLNLITVKNVGLVARSFFLQQKGVAMPWSSLSENSFRLEPGTEKVIYDHINPSLTAGQFELKTIITAEPGYEKILDQSIIVGDCSFSVAKMISFDTEKCSCAKNKFTFEILNIGGVSEEYGIGTSDFSEYISLDNNHFSLGPNQKKSVTGFVNLPCDQTGLKEFSFIVSMERSGKEIVLPASFTIGNCFDFGIALGNAAKEGGAISDKANANKKLDVCSGETYSAPVFIENKFVGDDTYTLSLSDNDIVELENNKIFVSGKTRTYGIIDIEPKASNIGENQIVLTAVSKTGQKQAELTFSVNVKSCTTTNETAQPSEGMDTKKLLTISLVSLVVIFLIVLLIFVFRRLSNKKTDILIGREESLEGEKIREETAAAYDGKEKTEEKDLEEEKEAEKEKEAEEEKIKEEKPKIAKAPIKESTKEMIEKKFDTGMLKIWSVIIVFLVVVGTFIYLILRYHAISRTLKFLSWWQYYIYLAIALIVLFFVSKYFINVKIRPWCREKLDSWKEKRKKAREKRLEKKRKKEEKKKKEAIKEQQKLEKERKKQIEDALKEEKRRKEIERKEKEAERREKAKEIREEAKKADAVKKAEKLAAKNKPSQKMKLSSSLRKWVYLFIALLVALAVDMISSFSTFNLYEYLKNNPNYAAIGIIVFLIIIYLIERRFVSWTSLSSEKAEKKEAKESKEKTKMPFLFAAVVIALLGIGAGVYAVVKYGYFNAIKDFALVYKVYIIAGLIILLALILFLRNNPFSKKK